MEHCRYIEPGQPFEHLVPQASARKQNVIHVGVVRQPSRHDRPSQHAPSFQAGEYTIHWLENFVAGRSAT